MLKVTTPSTDRSLCTLDEVKQQLGITGNEHDTTLSQLIARYSFAIEAHCRRVFTVQGYEETLLFDYPSQVVTLAMPPLNVFTSISQDGTVIDTDQLLFDSGPGIIHLRGSTTVGQHLWPSARVQAREVVVLYSGGFSQLPKNVTQACIRAVAAGFAARERDPALSRVSIPQVITNSYQGGIGAEGGVPALPKEVQDFLEPYVLSNINVGR